MKEQRGDDRLKVVWTGRLVTEDDQSYPCDVCDVSLAGTLVATDAGLPIGSLALLEIDDLGEFAVEVKWVGEKQLGLSVVAGPDLMLKRFAEAGGVLSERPMLPR